MILKERGLSSSLFLFRSLSNVPAISEDRALDVKPVLEREKKGEEKKKREKRVMSVFDLMARRRRRALFLSLSSSHRFAVNQNSPRRGLAHGALEAPERRNAQGKSVSARGKARP